MEVPSPVGTFTVWDYVVFALMLLISTAIGLYSAYVGRAAQTTNDFLLGGRSMTPVPVALSLTASFMSAIVVLATPAEVYIFGAIYGLHCLTFILVVVVSSEVFLPVFYRLGITSTNEYLELRFNKPTRLFVTALYILQTVFYAGVVIYAPALALNQVTGFDLWGAVVLTGAVCIFYCTMGGLRAVVWTDAFQVGIMVAGFLSVIIKAVVLRGGVSTILSDAEFGGRLNMWDFDPNPLKRYTFWTVVVGGSFSWLNVYATNQAQVQRYVSCKSIIQAKLALYLNLVGLCVILLCAVFAGLCLYSFYKQCDPWTSNAVSSTDQLMPYLVLDILRDHPGLPGLFVAAAYSGTLSTVSSSINALATVTLEDLFKPHMDLSEKQLSLMSKGLTFIYGVVCIGMAGFASLLGGVLQTTVSIFGVISGPVLGLFSFGILCPFGNSRSAAVGMFCGLALSLWVCVGAQLYSPLPEWTRPLKLVTDECNITNLTADQALITPSPNHSTQYRPFLAEDLYSVSYLYYAPIGALTTVIVALIVSLLSGGRKFQPAPRLTLSKEDLTFYYLLKLMKEKALRRSGRVDLVKNTVKERGNMNPAFSNTELYIISPNFITDEDAMSNSFKKP
ncbi:sodium-coupled monocarboxylate transporter 1 [Denticeps clupeoides]|uniref:sodium-coupled monocarboxylate transporter 1 n=1 Tax=Denticeps clupeoides TaxID=299321 RepID=UPI0010A370E3|nr:sodium-coupled monocarboxylate transporter 1 [Denticeps clupeoides]